MANQNKKFLFILKIRFVIVFMAFAFMIGCKKEIPNLGNQKNVQVTKKDTINEVKVKFILGLIKNKKFDVLANYIHPEEGIRFSPYGFINIDKDQKFNKNDFLKLTKSNKTIIWGNYDGSGEEIKLNWNGYYEKFIYDADFLFSEKISYNKIQSKGNSINNINQIYKNCEFVECYFSGFDNKFNGMDWVSLKLVFKKTNKKNYLLAIIHDQWTI